MADMQDEVTANSESATKSLPKAPSKRTSKLYYESLKTRREIKEHLMVLEGAVYNATKNLELWQSNLDQFKKEKRL